MDIYFGVIDETGFGVNNGDGDLKYVDKIDVVLDNMGVELLGKKD